MRLRLGTTIALALLVGATLAGSSAAARSTIHPTLTVATPPVRAAHVSKVPWGSEAGRVVPRQVVVVWKAGVPDGAKRGLAARLDTTLLAPAAGLGVDVVKVPAGRSMGATIRSYRGSPLVRFAEPNRIANIAAVPDDTFFDQQWALENTGQVHALSAYPPEFPYGEIDHGTANADVDALGAWDTQTGSASTVIAVIDTGVDISHPDLINEVVPGYDFFDNNADPTPGDGLENSHGTHVAGIIAAEQNNTEGVSGICPGCKVMPIRIGTAKKLTLARELKGINFAIANGADIINLSLVSPIWSKAERAAISKAGRHGILVVAAAGNSSMDNDIQFYDHLSDGAWAPSFPATYTLPNIISVAASNDRDQYGYVSQCRGSGIPLFLCGFTSWGHDSVDVAAPGVDIVSTVKVGQGPALGIDPTDRSYDVWDGTSMATPMVAGIAGLVLSENPSYSAIQVKNAIMNSVDHPPSLKLYTAWAGETKTGKKLLSGHFTRTQGRVNASTALTASSANATPKTDGNIDGARLVRKRRTGSVSWPADANDVFRKKLVKGSKYRVVLNGPRGRDFDLWVWKPGTKEIFQFTAGCFQSGGACPALEAFHAGKTADEAVTFKARKTGVFYIQVNGWYSGGNYALTVKKL